MSVLTNLGGNLNPEHPLVRQVQEKTGLQESAAGNSIYRASGECN